MPTFHLRLSPAIEDATLLGVSLVDRWRAACDEAGLQLQTVRHIPHKPGADDITWDARFFPSRLTLVQALEMVREQGVLTARLLPQVSPVAWTGSPHEEMPQHLTEGWSLARPAGLRRAESALLEHICEAWMDRGVRFVGPAGCWPWIEEGVELEAGAIISTTAILRGRTRVGAGSQVESGAQLLDTQVGKGAIIGQGARLASTTVGDGTHLLPYTVTEGAVVGEGCKVGPFVQLRPGSQLEEGVKVGNFVETKKTILRNGAKANHFSYLGDADVGPRVNVGAGTITCNYDGARKHRTVIGEGAFIGTNSSLVAPVRIGAQALVSAGAVVTDDVPDGGLAIARAPQKNIDGKGKAILDRNRKLKEQAG